MSDRHKWALFIGGFYALSGCAIFISGIANPTMEGSIGMVFMGMLFGLIGISMVTHEILRDRRSK